MKLSFRGRLIGTASLVFLMVVAGCSTRRETASVAAASGVPSAETAPGTRQTPPPTRAPEPARDARGRPDWPLPSALLDRLVDAGIVSEPALVAVADGLPEDAPKGISVADVEEIRAALLRMGYATLVIRVPPLDEGARIQLDGQLLAEFPPSRKAVEFRMTRRLPNDDGDRMELVSLDTNRDGRSLRWQRWIERRTGMYNSLDFAPSMITPLSFSASAARQANPHVVYAGDLVRLQSEAVPAQTFQELYWLVFEGVAEVAPDTFSATPTPLATMTGVPTILDLRKRIAKTLRARDSLFDAPQSRSRIIGTGARIDWRPQYESPSVVIGLLGFDRLGQWSMAVRTVQVVDGRPSVWVMPETTLERGALADYQPRFPYGSVPQPLDIYAIQDVMAQATFQGVAGQAMQFTLHQTDFRDAQAPARQVTVDWGDDAAAASVPPGAIEGARLTHAYSKAGTYRLSVQATDIFGMTRDVVTTLRITEPPSEPAAAAPPPPPPPPATVPEPVRVEVTLRREMSSFDLFRQCVNRWANNVVRRLDGVATRNPMVLALLPDPGPGHFNQRVAVLKDQAVVEATVSDGLNDGGDIAGVADHDPAILAALLKGSVNLSELAKQDANAMARVFGSGRSQAFKAGQPDSNTGDLFLQQLGESVLAKGLPLYEREGEWAAALNLESKVSEDPKPDRLVCFKVKRAGVLHFRLPNFIRREATVYTMVRVYDLSKRSLLKTWTQEETVSDLINAYDYPAPDAAAWDSYPPGFMATFPAGSAASIVPAGSSSGKLGAASDAKVPTPTQPEPAAQPSPEQSKTLFERLLGG